MFQRKTCIVFAAAFTLAVPALNAQTTWWVDATAPPGGNGSQAQPYTHVQNGIAAAQSGDTVRVLPGTYFESIDFLNKSIEVASTAGAASTVLYGNGSDTVVFMKGDAPVLEGFTIRNGGGRSTPNGTMGGGIFLNGTTAAMVRLCTVRLNYATFGDGIAARAAHAAIVDCTIEDNGGSTFPGWCQTGDNGGGAYGPVGLVLYGCTIRRNGATSNGGGVYGCTVDSCTVEENYASEGAGLSHSFARLTTIARNMGRSCDDSFAAAGGADASTLEDCSLIDNWAWDEAGGARDSSLVRCIVRDNRVTSPITFGVGFGGGALDCAMSDSWIEGNWVAGQSYGFFAEGGGASGGSALRCVFTRNTADNGAGVSGTTLDRCTVYFNQGVGFMWSDVVSSIVRANTAGSFTFAGSVSYSDIEGGAPGVGNFDLDPRFWMASNADFHLQPSSPCIDTGDPGVLDPDGSRADMGAFPYDASDCLTPVVYCPQGQSSNGCTPSIFVSGTPSISASSGFTIGATQIPGARVGLVLYGVSGETQLPWGSTSWSCVATPRKRTALANSGGTPGVCNGTIALDLNAWLDALGSPLALGTIVWSQIWYRDSGAAQGSNFTNAVRFSMCP